MTSKLTFVPRNYDDLIVAAASLPEIGGLLILDNVGSKSVQSGRRAALFQAPRVSLQLLLNACGPSHRRRLSAYRKQGKPVWILPTVNQPEALALIKDHSFDLLINARTRCIYQQACLLAPRYGCINIHHGLLPNQRGTMSDLWALSQGNPAGFSIHLMTANIDEGGIINVVQVSNGTDQHYLKYLQRSAKEELVHLRSVLQHISVHASLPPLQKQPAGEIKHTKNPTPQEMSLMKQRGMRL